MDVTMLVMEAQDARGRMQEARKRIKYEVKRKYEQAMAREIAERTEDAEREFAQTLKRVHSAGVPQSVLRREVLRTNVWSEWTKWRDLAQIEPDRVVAQNTKAKALSDNSAFVWSDDYSLLTVRKFRGADLEMPVVYDMHTNRQIQGKWWPDATNSAAERAVMGPVENRSEYSKALHEEIQSKIDAGLIRTNEEA